MEGAVQLAYGTRDVTAFLSYSASQYSSAIGVTRFDQRPFSELDDRR